MRGPKVKGKSLGSQNERFSVPATIRLEKYQSRVYVKVCIPSGTEAERAGLIVNFDGILLRFSSEV